jgi:hypothetical protein
MLKSIGMHVISVIEKNRRVRVEFISLLFLQDTERAYHFMGSSS